MKNVNKKKDIYAKIKEADAYYHHELYTEAKELYEQILADISEIDSATQSMIFEKIANLEKVIEDREQYDTQTLSTQDISLIKAGDIEESIPEILEGASAYKELGLYEEAITEYNKLFKFKYSAAKIIPNLIACLIETNSPVRVIEKIDKIISEKKLPPQETAQIKFDLGREMEKKEHKDLALECYKAVQSINPEFPDLKTKMNSMASSRSYNSKYAYLLENHKVTAEQLKFALDSSKKSKKSVEYILMEQKHIQKEEIGKSLSYFYNCPFKSYGPDMPVPHELLGKLREAYLKTNCWVPLSWNLEEGAVEVLVDDPKNLSKTDTILSLVKAKKINLAVGIKEDIEQIIKYFFSSSKATKETQEEEGDEEDSAGTFIADVDFEEEADSEEVYEQVNEHASQVVRSVDQIIISAYRKGASDIHIEPSIQKKKTIIRYRLDGVCQELLKLPISMAAGIISRLKVMSGLDIAEKRMPQDGKIKFRRKGIKPFELRLATLPTAGGFEDAVLRILAESGAMQLDKMGIHERNLRVFQKLIQQPYGLVLVVGPTGSGKTTTLHSALSYINKPGVKIWTAEDPVEITQEGLRQVQCEHKIGLDFARVMRAFLRADPNVIMIGEMRDKETAAIAIEASLTGHLVLSTLHTNSAPETITRLLDMGLNALNFSDAFLCVMAQRLLRKLCSNCREEYHPSQEEFNDIVLIYGKEHFNSTGIKYTPDFVLYRSKGCDVCNGSGYKGRIGVHELMEGTPTIKKLIKIQAPTEELFVQGAKDGMITLRQDGILKAFAGLTDLNEIRRVCST